MLGRVEVLFAGIHLTLYFFSLLWAACCKYCRYRLNATVSPAESDFPYRSSCFRSPARMNDLDAVRTYGQNILFIAVRNHRHHAHGVSPLRKMKLTAQDRGCAWGTMDTLPEIPGIALRFDGHVGVYIGGGYAVEARGFNYGCVKNEGFFPEVDALVSAALRGLWRRGIRGRERGKARYPGERVYHEPNRLLTTRRAFRVKNIPSRLKSLRTSQRITALRSDGRAFQPRASSTKSVFRCF